MNPEVRTGIDYIVHRWVRLREGRGQSQNQSQNWSRVRAQVQVRGREDVKVRNVNLKAPTGIESIVFLC